jgi:hypothetical protein
MPGLVNGEVGVIDQRHPAVAEPRTIGAVGGEGGRDRQTGRRNRFPGLAIDPGDAVEQIHLDLGVCRANSAAAAAKKAPASARRTLDFRKRIIGIPAVRSNLHPVTLGVPMGIAAQRRHRPGVRRVNGITRHEEWPLPVN